jgi:hypothetical protein
MTLRPSLRSSASRCSLPTDTRRQRRVPAHRPADQQPLPAQQVVAQLANTYPPSKPFYGPAHCGERRLVYPADW